MVKESGRLTFNHWLVCCSWLDSERPVLDIVLDGGVIELPANQSLSIEDCVQGVHCHLQDIKDEIVNP